MSDPSPAAPGPTAAPQAAAPSLGRSPAASATQRPIQFASPTIELATLPTRPTTQPPASATVGAEASSIPAAAAKPAQGSSLALPAIPADLWRSLARHGLLLPLLRQNVIAAAVADQTISEEESLQCRQAWGAANRLGSTEAVLQHLSAHALEDKDAIWQAELPRRISLHCEQHFSHRAEQRFLARKNQLDHVIYSLLRVEDGALARELYLRIAEGEADFAELAASYSKGAERSTRGVVGPVPLLQAHPQLAELLRTSRPGQLRPPLRIEQWWLVVRLESLRSASFDDEMRARMSRELFDEWVEEEVQAVLAAHREIPQPA